MRYRETLEQTDKVASVNSDMVLGTAVYTLVLGVGFIVFGTRVGKRWVTFWGATMVLAGIAYLIAVVAGVG
jgi:hypothetical protein